MAGETYNRFKYGSSMQGDVPFGAVEKKGSSEKVKDVVDLAAKIDQQKLMDQNLSVDDRRTASENFLQTEFGVNNLQDIRSQGNQENIDKLAKAVFLVGTYGSSEDVVDAFGFGVLSEIRNVLPETLQGLEPEIRSNVITDDYLMTQMRLIDRVRSEIRFVDYESIALYERRLMSVYEGLSDPATVTALAQHKKEIKLAYGTDRKGAKVEIDLLDIEYTTVQTYLAIHIQDIQERMSVLPRGEVKLPESKEAQLDLALTALLSLQSSGFKYSDLFVMEQSRILSAFANPRAELPVQPDSEVAAYVVATMKTISQRALLHQADGFMAYSGAEGATIEKALGQAQADRNLYDRKDVDIIWGTDAWISKKLVVREFWDKLQEVNEGNGYIQMLKKLVTDQPFLDANKDFMQRWGIDLITPTGIKVFLEKKVGLVAPDNRLYDELGTNMYSDAWLERKKLAEKYIIFKVDEEKKTKKIEISDIALQSSWILAKDLAETTGIDALWNKALIGHRDDTELYLFYLSVKDYMEHFKSVGGWEIAGQMILSAGRPWLHHAVNWDVGTILKSDDIIAGMKAGMFEKKQQDYWVSLERAVGQWKQLILRPGFEAKDVMNDVFASKYFDKCTKVGKLGAVLAVDDASIDRYFELFPPKDKTVIEKYKNRIRKAAGVTSLKDGDKCWADTFERKDDGSLVIENGARKEDKIMVGMISQRARELLVQTVLSDIRERPVETGWINEDVLFNLERLYKYFSQERIVEDIDVDIVKGEIRIKDLLEGNDVGYKFESQEMKTVNTKRKRNIVKKSFVQRSFIDNYVKTIGLQDIIDGELSKYISRQEAKKFASKLY